MPKFVVLLRVKDGSLFIDKWLECFGGLADEIVVVDNGSTDGTLEVLRTHPRVVEIRETVGFDEGRDKNLLHEMARNHEAEWIMDPDVDEVFESRMTRSTLEHMMSNTRVSKYRFRLFHFASPTHYNADVRWLWYTARPARMMWRNTMGGHFSDELFDIGSVRGISGRTTYSHLRMLHFGSAYPDHVKKKVELYRSVDASREDSYQRILTPSPRLRLWREFDESPVRVAALNVALDVLMLTRSVVERVQRGRRG